MTSTKINRRKLLRGAGGCALAIPVLESLQPRSAQAGGSIASPRRFVAIRNPHGGCWERALFGTPNPDDTQNYAGHTIRRTELAATQDGGTTRLSDVLRAPTADFTPELVAKMNLIQGIDSTVSIGHNRGGLLGNPNSTDSVDVVAATEPRPTIDQLLAWSSWFYDDLSTIAERSIHVGSSLSFGSSNPDDASGEIQPTGDSGDLRALFDRVSMSGVDEEANPRPLIVDRVLGEYRSLREGDRRLSVADRRRLDDHMARIDELQRKLEIVVDCGEATFPELGADVYPWAPGYYGDPDKNREFWQAVNEIVSISFACDTSRIAVLGVSDQSVFSNYVGDWHEDVAHRAQFEEVESADLLPQLQLQQSYQRIFQDVFLDLIRRLDVDDGTGTTILDNSLVMWGMECGPWTHDCSSMPLITAGSVSGVLRTGQHLDYRNHNSPYVDEYGTAFMPGGEPVLTGLTTNQFLGSVLQAFGLPPSDYESGQTGGYGEDVPSPARAGFYPSSVLDRMGDRLPWFFA